MSARAAEHTAADPDTVPGLGERFADATLLVTGHPDVAQAAYRTRGTYQDRETVP